MLAKWYILHEVVMASITRIDKHDYKEEVEGVEAVCGCVEV